MASNMLVERVSSTRTPRVKSVEMHPTEDWMLCGLYSGEAVIWDTRLEKQVNSFQVCDLPVRTAKFVARHNWVVTGSDDMMINVFNYHTLANERSFSAHSDYIRCIVVHPTLPYVLSCGDDLLIKLWDWSKKWTCSQVFESHTHYVMQIVISPKEDNTFASASLDRTVKVWSMGNTECNFTLSGHEKGVNTVDYCPSKDKPYLVTGSDDCTVKVWDYINRICVHTLQGHTNNVTAVLFHPTLPLLLSGSEDGTLKIWDPSTFTLDSSHNYGYERIWTACGMLKTNAVLIGYDEGMVVIKIGTDQPVASLDANSGKLLLAKHSDIQQLNLRALSEAQEKDGEHLNLLAKDLGSSDIYPQAMCHSENGRFLSVCDSKEFVIYTSVALRTKAFGRGKQFVWGDSSQYAVLENSRTVVVYRNFEKCGNLHIDGDIEAIFGGRMLGVKSDILSFYDWDKMNVVKTIEIEPRDVFWSQNGDYVCLTTDTNFYILSVTYRDEIVFELASQVNEIVTSGVWIDRSFIFTDANREIRACVEGATHNVARLDGDVYILGYMSDKNRLYACDRKLNVTSYWVCSAALAYEGAVLRADDEEASRILPSVPDKCKPSVAHFLDQQGFKREALQLTTEPEHRFELALSTGNLDVAKEAAGTVNSASIWSKLGCSASLSNMQLAMGCFERAGQHADVLLYGVCSGDKTVVQTVADKAKTERQLNVAFLANFLLADLDACVHLLVDNGRMAEAAFFARSYVPSKITEVVGAWRESLKMKNEKLAQSIAEPEHYSNLFPEYEESLILEKQQLDVCLEKIVDEIQGDSEAILVKEMESLDIYNYLDS